MDIVRQIKLFWRHLCRMPRTRGFGVQSPTAYSFLRHTLNERIFLRDNCSPVGYPFEAPEQERLRYRLSLYSSHVVVRNVTEVMALCDSCDAASAFPITDYPNDAILLVDMSGLMGDTHDVMQRIFAQKRITLAFDLSDCAVFFFDETKSKQLFKVNY